MMRHQLCVRTSVHLAAREGEEGAGTLNLTMHTCDFGNVRQHLARTASMSSSTSCSPTSSTRQSCSFSTSFGTPCDSYARAWHDANDRAAVKCRKHLDLASMALDADLQKRRRKLRSIKLGIASQPVQSAYQHATK